MGPASGVTRNGLRSPMSSSGILVGLGNPIMSDDGVGIVVCRRVHGMLAGYDLDLSCGAGLHVMDAILGYRRAVIIDSMVTGKFPVGTVAEVGPDSGVETRRAGHSHGVGFFEAIDVARVCKASLPGEIIVYGIEVEDPFTIGDVMSDNLLKRLDEIVEFIIHDLKSRG